MSRRHDDMDETLTVTPPPAGPVMREASVEHRDEISEAAHLARKHGLDHLLDVRGLVKLAGLIADARRKA